MAAFLIRVSPHQALASAPPIHCFCVSALGSYDKAIALKPNYADAHWNQSLCLLQMGQFERGWRQYEWRKKRAEPHSSVRSYPQPLWLGDEDIAGKILFVYWEQGLGTRYSFTDMPSSQKHVARR